jgi:hypothetical protein
MLVTGHVYDLELLEPRARLKVLESDFDVLEQLFAVGREVVRSQAGEPQDAVRYAAASWWGISNQFNGCGSGCCSRVCHFRCTLRDSY